jgi:hypothetical protein
MIWFLLVGCVCGCSNYVLQNECTDVIVDSVELSEEVQPILFNILSLPISDVRMIPSSCRRPLLSFLCNYYFVGSCSNSTGFGCIPLQSICEEVNTVCGTSIFNCTEMYANINKTQCDINTTTPIPVLTCLSAEDQITECCASPYKLDRYTKECVIGCPPDVLFYKEEDVWDFQIFYFSLLMLGFAVLIPAAIPMFLIPDFLLFPRYIHIILAVNALLAGLFDNFSFFDGRREYLCGDEDDFLVAYSKLSVSPICRFQFFFIIFFLIFFVYWFSILALVALSFVYHERLNFFSYLSPSHPKNNVTQFWILIGAIGVSSGVAFANLALAIKNPEEYVGIGNTFCCWPHQQGPGYSFWIPWDIIGFFAMSGMVFAMIGILRRSIALFYLNLRHFIVLIYNCLSYFYVIFIINYTEVTWTYVLTDYAECATLHPREVGYCKPEDFVKKPIVIDYFLFSIFPIMAILISVVTLWTTPIIYNWWHHVIYNGSLPRYDSTSITPQSNSNMNLHN